MSSERGTGWSQYKIEVLKPGLACWPLRSLKQHESIAAFEISPSKKNKIWKKKLFKLFFLSYILKYDFLCIYVTCWQLWLTSSFYRWWSILQKAFTQNYKKKDITTDDNKNYLDITYATDCRDTFYFQKCMLNIFFFSKNKMYPCLFINAFWTAETLNKRPFNV